MFGELGHPKLKLFYIMIAFTNAPSYVDYPVAVVLTTTEQKKVNLEGHMCTASVILVAPPQCNFA